MADYFSPTVIQQTIPLADVTPLERLVLSQVFTAERDDEGWYFYAEEGPALEVTLSRAELAAALAASERFTCALNAYVAERLAGRPTAESVDLDLSDMSWEFIVQDILRRSTSLRYVTAVSAFICSRMRPDGFGGRAVLITRSVILDNSTDDFIKDCLAEAVPDAEVVH